MEDAKKKSAEEMKVDVKESSGVGTDSKTEAGGVSQKSKSVSSSATEQDLDVFLLGDLGDSDDGPGILLCITNLKFLILCECHH